MFRFLGLWVFRFLLWVLRFLLWVFRFLLWVLRFLATQKPPKQAGPLAATRDDFEPVP